MATKSSYTLTRMKQLIDLNGDSMNFDLTFKVTSEDNDTLFNVLVVDQNTLDNTPELKYKEVRGTISGNIVADKNIYQNYFLILKAVDKSISVEVEIVKKELPKTPVVFSAKKVTEDPTRNMHLTNTDTTNTSSTNWTRIIITGVCVVGIVFLIYWVFFRAKKEEINSTETGTNFGFTFNSPPKIKNISHSPSPDMKAYPKTDMKAYPKTNMKAYPKTDMKTYPSISPDIKTYRPSLSYGPRLKKVSNSPDALSEESSKHTPIKPSLLDRLKKFQK